MTTSVCFLFVGEGRVISITRPNMGSLISLGFILCLEISTFHFASLKEVSVSFQELNMANLRDVVLSNSAIVFVETGFAAAELAEEAEADVAIGDCGKALNTTTKRGFAFISVSAAV